MSSDDDCPCGPPEHPARPLNPPGQASIAYRPGDFASFRRALLATRAGEEALAAWRPGTPDSGDLALQMLEWWAYLADVLGFYNERAASEAFLRTAVLPESVRRLVGLLGYRPRPGIGATALLTASLSEPRRLLLEPGLAVQSKPRPGIPPQIFELDTQVAVSPPELVAAEAPPDAGLAGKRSLLLAGKVTQIAVGQRLLLLPRRFGEDGTGHAVLRVDELAFTSDPRGRAQTRLAITMLDDQLPASAQLGDYRLVRSRQVTQPWAYVSIDAVTEVETHLRQVVRSLTTGSPVLFEIEPLLTKLTHATTFDLHAVWMAASGAAPAEGLRFMPRRRLLSAPSFALVRVVSHDERVWFANGPANDPSNPPGGNTPPIAILHTVLGYEHEPRLAEAQRVTVHHDFVDVGTLVPVPRTSIGPDDQELVAAGATSFPIGRAQPVVVEAADGQGQRARLDSRDGRSAELVWPAGESFRLTAPFRVHFGVLPVSRGQSVLGEVLGSGDPARPGQEFSLAKSPLTYLASADPAWSGYRSTLRIWVSGVEWLEVPSFYAQPADARVFVTREDDEQKTHVRFGDGEHGARLPAGQDNVVADYRFGSGAKSPPAGTLTALQKPPPGLRGVKNPVAAGGGADPDPPAQIRRYAPRSVLAFGRAVSADDYETIAARAPSVRRARAVSTWDAAQQRTLVTVFVGDDAAAVAAARDALRAAADPNRPRRVVQAQALPVRLSLSLAIAPRYKPAEVAARVRAALLDDERGPFAPLVAQIGEPLFESQIDEVCLAVSGVEAVHELSFSADGAARSGARLRPPAGGFFTLDEGHLDVSAEESKRG